VGCTPISVTIVVIDPDEKLIKVDFGLAKACNDDGTVTWKIDFKFFERDEATKPFGDPLISFDLVVGKDNHVAAEKAATAGLTEDQEQQALAAGDTAKAVKTGDATIDDAKTDAEAVLTAGSEPGGGD
jgi:hypothetical protein